MNFVWVLGIETIDDIKDQEKLENENPPVGIIFCTEPNRSKVFVEYALCGLSNKVFVSKYKLYLPTKRDL